MACSKKKKILIPIVVVLGVIVVAVSSFFIYTGIYYHATDAALAALGSTENYTVTDNGDSITFAPESPKAGLIFYPGGKVEHTAYAPLMAELAKRDVFCVLLKAPLRLAVLKTAAADGVKEKYPQVSDWYIGGHSLGGTVASIYLEKHISDYKGLLLLGAYSTSDLSGAEIKVVSVYGSEDRVMNREKYDRNKSNLPPDFCELVIEGGCHAYFGEYGAQSGDGKSAISSAEQQALTAEFFCNNIFIAPDGNENGNNFI